MTTEENTNKNQEEYPDFDNMSIFACLIWYCKYCIKGLRPQNKYEKIAFTGMWIRFLLCMLPFIVIIIYMIVTEVDFLIDKYYYHLYDLPEHVKALGIK